MNEVSLNPATGNALARTDTLARSLALVRLCDARQRELFGFRAARLIGPLSIIGSAAAMFVLWSAKQPDATLAVAVHGVGTLSWLVAATAGTSAAQDLDARDAADGIPALIGARGHVSAALGPARLIAAACRLGLLVLLPGLALTFLALLAAPNGEALLRRLALSLGIVAYSALFGALLAGVARAASAASPKHGRSIYAAVILVPFLANFMNDAVPSLPSMLGGLLELLLRSTIGA